MSCLRSVETSSSRNCLCSPWTDHSKLWSIHCLLHTVAGHMKCNRSHHSPNSVCLSECPILAIKADSLHCLATITSWIKSVTLLPSRSPRQSGPTGSIFSPSRAGSLAGSQARDDLDSASTLLRSWSPRTRTSSYCRTSSRYSAHQG